MGRASREKRQRRMEPWRRAPEQLSGAKRPGPADGGAFRCGICEAMGTEVLEDGSIVDREPARGF